MCARIAVITGVSSGIGRAAAERLLQRGDKVVGNARGEMGLSDLKDWSRDKPGEFVPIAGNAADPETAVRLIETCRDHFGAAPCVGLVNAGRGLPGTLNSSDADQWQDMVNLNVMGAFHQLRTFAEAMTAITAEQSDLSKAHDIVVLGSSIGTNVSPINPVYGATKFAVHGATEALRREIGPKGVRVTLIQPGIVKTNFQSAAGYDPETFGAYADTIGPLVEADDVARTIEFVLDQPPHVHLHDIMVRPTRQPYP